MYVLTGRFGPYVQLGEQEEGTKKKPKRSSLFAIETPETVTLDEALQLLSLPRVVGADAEGREIVASPGRFGPYLKRADGDTRSLAVRGPAAHGHDGRGRGAVRAAEDAARPSAEAADRGAGRAPRHRAPVRVLDGRYGPYVTDGTVNATVPRGTDPAELTLPEAVALLRARAERAPKKAKKAAKKATKKTAKKAAKKTTKKAAKKAAKKATAKKAGGRRPSRLVPVEQPAGTPRLTAA